MESPPESSPEILEDLWGKKIGNMWGRRSSGGPFIIGASSFAFSLSYSAGGGEKKKKRKSLNASRRRREKILGTPPKFCTPLRPPLISGGACGLHSSGRPLFGFDALGLAPTLVGFRRLARAWSLACRRLPLRLPRGRLRATGGGLKPYRLPVAAGFKSGFGTASGYLI